MLIAAITGIMIAGILSVALTTPSVYSIGGSGQIHSHGEIRVNGGNNSGGDESTLLPNGGQIHSHPG